MFNIKGKHWSRKSTQDAKNDHRVIQTSDKDIALQAPFKI